MRVDFQRLEWTNYPDTDTPIDADNLNRIEEGVAGLYADLNDTIGDVENLKTTVPQNTSEINTLKSRVDNIIALPDGSTTADAELVDIRTGAGGETYPSAGDAVRGQIGNLKNAIGNKSSLNTDTKTNLVSAINEVNGRFLDGIDTAVENWLDDHPEATTTVQDGSLTLPKFKDGELPFVTPKMFGAKGDGETDDTQAICNALTYCHENGTILFVPAGIYIYNGALEYGSIILIGAGIGKTIFKLKDDCTIPSGRFITGFSIKPGLNDIKQIVFRDFEIDGNASNNRHWTDTQFGQWINKQDSTQCHGIRTEPFDLGSEETSNYAEYTELSGLYIHDTIRDNVSIVSNGYVIVKNCVFENSDTDHLLYLQTLTGDTFVENCVLKGYANGHIQSSKASFNNIRFEEVEINPALELVTSSVNFSCFTAIDRSLSGQKTGLSINNVSADLDLTDIVNNFWMHFIVGNSFVNIDNCHIDTNNTGNFTFFYADGNTSTADTPKVGLKANGIIINNLSNKSVVLSIGHRCDNDVLLSNSEISFAEAPTNNGFVVIGNSVVKGIYIDNVKAKNIWNLVRCVNALSSDNVGKMYVTNSQMDVPNDTYIIDGSNAYSGFLNLTNVVIKKFRYLSVSPYIRYTNVVSKDDGDIKYIADAPASGSFVGDCWYYQGALKHWDGTNWV